MKRNLIIWLLVLISGYATQAQSYETLWKQVEELNKKGLPQSAIASLKQIYAQAEQEKNVPLMMKAYLTAMSFRESISADSLATDQMYLEEWAAREKSLENRAVLYSILAEKNVYSPDWEKSMEHLRLSIADKDLLLNTSSAYLAPMTYSEETSIRYFHDNLYHLLARRAIAVLQKKHRQAVQLGKQTVEMPNDAKRIEDWENAEIPLASEYDVVGMQYRIYQSLLKAYRKQGNREAWLLTALDAFDKRSANKPQQAEGRIQLEDWIREYGDLDVCAEVYLKLASFRQGKQVDKLSFIREGIRKYPCYERINALKNRENEILCPQLSVRLSALYPGKPMEMTVQHKNLDGFSLRIYKLDVPVESPLLQKINEQNVKEYGKLIRTEHFRLSRTVENNVKDTLQTVAPECGVYYYQPVSEGKPEHLNGCVVYVSRLYVMWHRIKEDVLRFVVVDAESGHLVPNAEICFYQKNVDGFMKTQSYLTHEDGQMVLRGMKSRIRYFNARTPEDRFMPIRRMSMGYWQDADDEALTQVTLFTDRSVYRPGQTVHFSGICHEVRKDSTRVLEGHECEVALKDRFNKNISVQTLKSDEYGVFSGTFVLPADMRLGEYCFKTDYGGWAGFHVEEYKRPTFDVTFEPVKSEFQMGDSIIVTGVVQTFAGAPVQEAVVKYRRTRASGLSNTELYPETGETVTDAEGRFQVKVFFSPTSIPYGKSYDSYKIKAEVTSRAGETQSGTILLPFGPSSLMIDINDGDESMTLMKENKKEIRFKVENLMKRPVDTRVRYSVYKLKKEAGHSYKETECVLTDSMQSNRYFLAENLYRLPSGCYQLKAEVKDDKGRAANSWCSFYLFSKEDRKMPFEQTFWIHQTGNQFDEKEPLTIYIGSNEQDVNLYLNILTKDRHVASKRICFSDSLLAIKLPYKEVYGDGIRFLIAFVKHGKLYDRSLHITKPLPHKHLNMKWEVFRDKLQSGGQEEWTLKVSHKDGTPASARLLASMYDASLDKIAYRHSWSMDLRMKRYVPYIVWFSFKDGAYGLNCTYPTHYLYVPNLSYSVLDIPHLLRSGKVYTLLRSDVQLKVENDLPGLRIRGYSETKQTDVTGSVVAYDLASPVVFEEEVWEESYVAEKGKPMVNPLAVRSNFAETAFFYPNLQTDANGEVSISFTLPESLTTWKFMGLAHTKDMDYGQTTAEAVASKEFMLQPNMPRFVRVGDEVSLSASLINLSDKDVIGNVRMELFNPKNDKIYLTKKQRFIVTPNATTTVHFGFEVSEEYTDLAVRWIAEGENFSDGEQRPLPVLSNKQWITESVPLYINGEGTKVFSLETLFNHHSKSITNPQMTIEFTGNPGWYAVQALPALANPQNEDALSWTTAFYAHSLTNHLVETNPDIAIKLDRDTLGLRTDKALKKLKELQNADGSWSWYKGMDGSRFITTQAAELLARLYAISGYTPQDRESLPMLKKAMDYLGKEAKKEYSRMMDA